ncbi:MAG: lytic transglycosylase domain-containing protein [Candidatus Eremiobacteraeota bacterium]|nr:lytic transglycosylase domain-containing protein [Candidatus Eremiobacteraeota bacterium]
MDISSDIVAVQSRIAEITGAPPPSAPGSAPEADSFASLVQKAMHGRTAESVMPGPAVPTVPGEGPMMVAPAEIDRLVSANAAACQVDPALVKAIIANESGFNASATSKTGAQGLMQLEPGTAASLGVRDSYDPAQNISGGTRYIKSLLDRFHGDMQLAVAAYNAGPGAVEKYGGVPPYAETRNYVGNVLDSYNKYKTQSP